MFLKMKFVYLLVQISCLTFISAMDDLDIPDLYFFDSLPNDNFLKVYEVLVSELYNHAVSIVTTLTNSSLDKLKDAI